MSNFEIGYCTYSEFRDGLPNRVNESELSIHGLYVVMFALDERSAIPAAKYPSQVTDVEPEDNGCYRVDFTVMNADLAPDYVTTGRFRDGYWLPAHSQQIEIGRVAVVSAYFKADYLDDEGEQELQDMISLEGSIAAHDPIAC